ncbi:GDP-L-fucose transporter [Paragonimus heterotremus]|uniref:GDP-L-fucose transporter n=1 Tax=Paragonimus heterotremus TaxID=100268 RepID=A0A8J4TK91_9TREM|nr:GDP-L-fucose transporter [Paragonimus heterotremus]
MGENRKSETIRVLYVVVSYWIVSISLVFINKWLLSDPDESPDAPLFVTWFQCCVTAGLCLVAANLSSLVPGFLNFPQLKFSSKTALDILPLSIVFVIMVSFNNLCLKHLNVSFYYLARSLTTVFNVIFTYLILHTSTSRYALLCCGVIVVGYGSGLNVEGSLGSLSFWGAFFGIGSSIACALTSILTARSLPAVEGSAWRLTFYNNLNAMVLFLPLIVLTEINNLRSSSFWFSTNFWSMMILSGVLGFAIGFVSTLQIKYTSPLTHNVCGTAKAAAQTVLAVVAYREVKSVSWWLSNLIVLLGSAAYTFVRHREMIAKSGMTDSKLKRDTPDFPLAPGNVKNTAVV